MNIRHVMNNRNIFKKNLRNCEVDVISFVHDTAIITKKNIVYLPINSFIKSKINIDSLSSIDIV